MDKLPTLSNVIKERRHKLGLTQKQLAQMLDVSDKSVSKWERGEGMPDISLLPQIALCLDVSIDYLFSGVQNTATQTESTQLNSENRRKTLAASAAMLQHKINTRYVIAIILVLFATFFCFFGQIVVFDKYISIVNWRYRPLLYSFIIAAIYLIYTFSINKHRLIFEDLSDTFTGHLDKVLALTSVSAVYFVLVFHYITDYSLWSFIDRLGKHIAQWLGASATNNSISIYVQTFMMSLCFMVYLTAVIANMLVSEKKSTFDSTVIITSAICTVMTVIHTVYFSFISAFILKNRTYLYAFWLENPKVLAFLEKLTVYNIVYAAVTLAVVAGFAFLLKEKSHRKVYAVCTLPLWLYHSISAFCFINRSFDGMGSYFAQLRAGSIMLSLALVAAIPHIAMVINGIAKSKGNPSKGKL